MEHFLQEPWREGRPALGLWSSIGDPLAAEALASVGPDYVCIDLQHGGTTEDRLLSMIQAVEAGGAVPLVRVAEANAAAIMKALDRGARGVIVPLVESAAQARLAVEACRFPPAGKRSFGPFRASIAARTSDPRELEKVACIVMVETRDGLDHLEEIVTTEGVTAVYLGPSDLSLALGLAPGSIDAPEFISLIEQVRQLCASHGVAAGMHCYNGTTARRAIEQGFSMVTVAVELRLLLQALAVELTTARGVEGR